MEESTGESSVVNLKLNPCERFLHEKMKAFGAFGKASLLSSGPSGTAVHDYQDFLIHRRRINMGRFIQEWKRNPKANEIMEAKFSPEILGINVWIPGWTPESSFIQDTCRRFKAVLSATTFKMMIDDLKKQKEFAIALLSDCGFHSFAGMTTIIEISTWEVDYVIDVLPLNKLIMEDLKPILESTDVFKYVFDGDRDCMKLNRDFLIKMVHACDIQLLLQEILKQRQFETLLKNIPEEIKKPWYIRFIGKRQNLTQIPQQLLWEEKASKTLLSYETVRELFYPEFNQSIAKEQVPGDSKSTEGHCGCTVIEYYHGSHVGRNRSNTLLSIVSFIKGNVSKEKLLVIFEAAYQRTKYKLFETYSPTLPMMFENYSSSKNAIRIPLQHLSLFRAIFNWRRSHAAIIDENPRFLFSEKQLLDFIQNKPTSMEEMVSRLTERTGLNKEYAAQYHLSWSKTLFGILEEGELYISKIMMLECHNCLKVGHAAWGCPEPPNKESNKILMRENPEWKARQNRRRQLNKRRNKRAREAEETK